jgi:hypothetical protein
LHGGAARRQLSGDVLQEHFQSCEALALLARPDADSFLTVGIGTNFPDFTTAAAMLDAELSEWITRSMGWDR